MPRRHHESPTDPQGTARARRARRCSADASRASWPPAAAATRRTRPPPPRRLRRSSPTGSGSRTGSSTSTSTRRRRSVPTLDQFTKETGVAVDYFEDINDNASYFGKIQRPLAQGQSIDRDIVVLTDNSRFPSLLIEKGWAEKLDKSAIPNISNLQDSLAHPSFDPDREYSLPWQSGMTGIATNTKLTGGKPIVTIDELLESPALKGKVTMLTEMADSIAVVMSANGDDPTKVDDASFTKAIDRIQKAVDSGQIRQFTGNDYTGPLSKGDLAAALSWSGDVVQLTLDNKNLEWNLPETGGAIWTDNMLIPKGGDVFTASTYMNFVYQPAIAAQIAAYINYVSP